MLSTISQAKTIDCPKEYNLHKDIISEYMIRIEDGIYSEGCDIIPVYSAIIEAENFDILDEIEENPKILQHLKKLSSINSNLSTLLFKSETIKKIVLTNSLNENFLENFTYLTEKKLQKSEIRKIEKNNSYLNYFLLASLYSENKRESIKLYSKIKSSVSIELMPSLSLILSSIGNEYKFSDLLENFAVLSQELSSDDVKTLAEYPQHFVYFLYPNKSSLDMGLLSSDKLKEVQKSIQKEVLYIYRRMFNKYRYKKNTNQVDYALLTIENIYPYLLENPTLNYKNFTLLFQKLIDKGYMFSLFKEDKCSKSTENNFAVFGYGNINKAIEFLKNEKQLSQKLFSKFKDHNYSIMSFFYVANAYGNLTKKEWKIFKNLLKTLPYEYDNKIVFLQRIEQSGYFRNIVEQSDYNDYIKPDDTKYGKNNPKYTYILLTPYPSQEDKTLFDAVLKTDIDNTLLQKSLVDLILKDRDELETHEFTKMERFFGNVDTLDNIATVASIAIVPFTGGVSLSYVAVAMARKATKEAGKKGFKYLRKKILLQSKKVLNKSIRKVRVTRKNIDNKIGVQNQNNIEKIDDSIANTFNLLTVAKSASIFFDSSSLNIKQICQE
jgi:hypothetical protein